MIISFDFGGTLDGQKDLVRLAQLLRNEGHTIYLLSGVANEQEIQVRKNFIAKHGLVFDKELYTKPDNSGGAREKAQHCRNLGITLHFDNSPAVASHVHAVSETMVVLVRAPRRR